MDQYDFDIANRMGEVFESIYDVSKYRELKKAYIDAFNDQDLNTIIANDSLYLLNRVRNLIVHEAGIVNRSFLDQYRLKFPGSSIGERIVYSPDVYSEMINSCSAMGIALLKRLSVKIDTVKMLMAFKTNQKKGENHLRTD